MSYGLSKVGGNQEKRCRSGEEEISEAPAFPDGEACTLSEERHPLFPAMA